MLSSQPEEESLLSVSNIEPPGSSAICIPDSSTKVLNKTHLNGSHSVLTIADVTILAQTQGPPSPVTSGISPLFKGLSLASRTPRRQIPKNKASLRRNFLQCNFSASSYQASFEQECANIVRVIQRFPCKSDGPGLSNLNGWDLLNVSSLEAEPSPNWDSNLELSCMTAEETTLEGSTVINIMHIDKAKEQMGHTQLSDVVEEEDDESVLALQPASRIDPVFGCQAYAPKSVSDTSMDFNNQLGEKESEVAEAQGARGHKTTAALNITADISTNSSSSSGTNVHTSKTQECTMEGIQGDTFDVPPKPEEFNNNKTYEQQQDTMHKTAVQPDVTGSSAGLSGKEGLDKMSPQKSGEFDSMCSLEAGSAAKFSFWSLDETIDMKSSRLITSTPLTVPKQFSFCKAPTLASVTLDLSKRHPVLGSCPGPYSTQLTQQGLKHPTISLLKPPGELPKHTFTKDSAVSKPRTSQIGLQRTKICTSKPLASTSCLEGPAKPSASRSVVAPKVALPKPRPSGLPAPVCQVSRVGLKTQVSAASSTEKRVSLSNASRLSALKDRVQTAHKPTQKQQRISVGEVLPVSKRKKIELPPTTTGSVLRVQGGSTRPKSRLQLKNRSNIKACGSVSKELSGTSLGITQIKADSHHTVTEASQTEPGGTPALTTGCQSCRHYQEDILRLQAELQFLQQELMRIKEKH